VDPHPQSHSHTNLDTICTPDGHRHVDFHPQSHGHTNLDTARNPDADLHGLANAHPYTAGHCHTDPS